MTQLYQRNLARHVRLARQDGKQGGNGNRSDNAGGVTPTPPSTPANTASNGNRGGGLDSLAVDPVSTASSPTTTDASVSSTPVSTVSSSPTSSDTPSSVQSTSSSPSVVQSSTTLSSSPTSTSAPTLKTSSTPLSSSTTFSSSQPISSVIQNTPTTTFSNTAIANPDPITPNPLSSFGTQTNVLTAATTVSASAVTGASSNLSAGNIVGAVVGTLIGLALVVILVAFVLRRYRRSRRRALRDSEFGTFRRSMFVTSSAPTGRSMTEIGHNVAPSLTEPYVPYSAGGAAAKQVSPTLAAATATTIPASGGVLQERPKYVYGQGPTTTSGKQEEQEEQQHQQHDDAVSDAHGGAYSSEPQVQLAYDAEAYANYAKYEDIGNGVVGGVPAGTAVYQDAERAYQGQPGYGQSHYIPAHYTSYDRSQYHGYGQQQQAYGYSSQHPQAL